ncbi:unnamed protein product [Acanthoscelides obtectus]|uniref:DNA repair and recombination protein RAD54-like n=1 Tax=Acanthoscelides obtectus TaxID=200917 RepID=A0A9P0P0T2_ACAOB|nr:unnamed protein product [Acanthoscelides obtectus]CAK1629113.1 DNA excision repair protein ERCC-6 [Acanthoscelides obtectus]
MKRRSMSDGTSDHDTDDEHFEFHKRHSSECECNPSCSKDFDGNDPPCSEDDSDGCEPSTRPSSDDEYHPSSGEEDSDEYEPGSWGSKRLGPATKKRRVSGESSDRIIDDGDMEVYSARMAAYYELKQSAVMNDGDGYSDNDDVLVMDDFKMPANTWSKLYPYQQKGVKWLYKLHKRQTGGILGDEMGLGKTVQVIAFLIGLNYSKLKSTYRWLGLGPSIIVCPTTVMHQWVRHFHEWAPELRVGLLHSSTSYKGKMSDFVQEMNKCGGILIMSYQGLCKYENIFHKHKCHYVILDEGHKVRTPTARMTIAAKQFKTDHRILLSGSPMQNNLIELWSLFDFTNPGLLGTLKIFEEHFSKPIMRGGYENASHVQKETSKAMAVTLNDLIKPFLLRRTKKEVQNDICLPQKCEQVLFCALSEEQKTLYKDFLRSDRVEKVLEKRKNWFSDAMTRANALIAIKLLRDICNHPDIYLRIEDDTDEPADIKDRFDYKRSGKMAVVSTLLRIWKQQRHRVLLFVQGLKTLQLLQYFLIQHDYSHLKMDGSTSVATRQSLIDRFNNDSKYFVFLLTTRVGGLGINLTGANRVIIFDPDWNPATDSQARERAWRIGQSKDVTIYRLLSVGTIEEKIYQRQIFKQMLGNRVLVNPRVDKQFFRTSDLFDLFSYNETEIDPETANIFDKAKCVKGVIKSCKEDDYSKIFSEEKIEEMREKARQIAAQNFPQEKPTAYQKEVAEERAEKLQEKEKLKALSAPDLVKLNREKAKAKEDPSINRVDDKVTPASFGEALRYAEATSQLHTELVQGKKTPDVVAEKSRELKLKVKMKETYTESFRKYMKPDKKKLTRKKTGEKDCKVYVDNSGAVDEVKVEGLVKTEIKIRKKRKAGPTESQEDYVLRKLLRKTSVSAVLEHESVVHGTSTSTLRLQLEAEESAKKSMEALRRARLDNSKWSI